MNTKHLVLLSGVLLAAAATNAFADCDNSSLNGTYAFRAQGATTGVIDASGILHPFASPQLLNSVGQISFDGNG